MNTLHAKKCAKCPAEFNITESDKKFYEKMDVPEPTLCPECRYKRRLAFRAERNLYTRKCSATDKAILSMYDENAPFPVYEISYWWGDKWDAMDYGQEFDFERPFFEQFEELMNKVPRMNLIQERNENSEYTNCVSNLKDCYLLFSSDYNRDCYYGIWTLYSNDCMDNLIIQKCELTYESIFSNNLYNCIFAIQSSTCRDSAFIMDCKNCSDCFMCTGLRGKQYCIQNVQYSKEEYEKFRTQYPISSHHNFSSFKAQFLEIMKGAVHLYMRRNGRIDNSTGNFLTDTMNCEECFEILNSKDCKYVQGGFDDKDCMDCSYVQGELGYETCECVPMPFNSRFNVNSYSGSDLTYCDSCMNNCRDCFGCIGLKQKQYCILNKQYTKEEYEALLPKIIEHMRKPIQGEGHADAWLFGEFFPGSISPFAYNESNAIDFFPLSKEEAIAQGYKWKEEVVKNVIPQLYTIPNDITEVTDEILTQVLTCEATGKNFKIIPQELKFYRQMGLPIPRTCPEARQCERMKFRTSRSLHDRSCTQCGTELRSVYNIDDPRKVFCEKCYLESVG
ncbi:hypothetical protein HOG48_04210 [Candidatus Peregrinibacteria bacterium]|jgi:hypothetical protein|nr:hypothetical protein [Candidatus Peregrinibacteria bacterium]